MSKMSKEEKRAVALKAAAFVEEANSTDSWEDFYERCNEFVKYIETGKTTFTSESNSARDD